MWLAIKAFLGTNALRLLQIGAAVAAVLLVLFNARSAGRSAEKVEQYGNAIKARKRADSVRRDGPAGVVDSLRRGEF